MSTKNPSSEPGRRSTELKKPRAIRPPTEAEVKKGSLYEMLEMLGTVVEPETLQSFRDKVLEILERKAAILAELRKIIGHETFLERLESFSLKLENFFIKTTLEINKLVSKIRNIQHIPDLEAAEKFIEKIQNLLYLDPEEDGDLINKLQSLLEISLKEISLKTRTAHFQLVLLLDG